MAILSTRSRSCRNRIVAGVISRGAQEVPQGGKRDSTQLVAMEEVQDQGDGHCHRGEQEKGIEETHDDCPTRASPACADTP